MAISTGNNYIRRNIKPPQQQYVFTKTKAEVFVCQILAKLILTCRLVSKIGNIYCNEINNGITFLKLRIIYSLKKQQPVGNYLYE